MPSLIIAIAVASRLYGGQRTGSTLSDDEIQKMVGQADPRGHGFFTRSRNAGGALEEGLGGLLKPHRSSSETAASVGISAAVLEAEDYQKALEEGRGGGGVYSEEGLPGEVRRLPSQAAGAAAAASVAAEAQAEAEAVSREAVAEAAAVAAEAQAEAAAEEAEAAEAKAADDAKAARIAAKKQAKEAAEAKAARAFEKKAAAAAKAEEEAEEVEVVEEVTVEAAAAEEKEEEGDADEVAEEAVVEEAEAPSVTMASAGEKTADAAAGGGDGSDGGDDAAEEEADSGELLARVTALKKAARAEGDSERWEAALTGYLEACELLVAEEGSGSGKVAKELQSCRLNGAVCCLQLQRWTEAIAICGDVLRENPRCATAHHRRAIALQGDGNLDAALWDLKRASQLQPKNARIASALTKAEKMVSKRKKRSSTKPGLHDYSAGSGPLTGGLPFGPTADVDGHEGADGLDGMMRSMLTGLAGGAGASGAPSSGAGAADGLGDLSSLFSSMMGGPAGGGLLGAGTTGGGGDSDASPLESLLKSPLASSMMGSGKGTKRMLSALSTVLTMQRRLKKVWRMLKPYIPLLFWLAVLMLARPFLLAHVVPVLRPYLPTLPESMTKAWWAWPISWLAERDQIAAAAAKAGDAAAKAAPAAAAKGVAEAAASAVGLM